MINDLKRSVTHEKINKNLYLRVRCTHPRMSGVCHRFCGIQSGQVYVIRGSQRSTGNYQAELIVGLTSTRASVDISNYDGIVGIDDCTLDGMVTGYNINTHMVNTLAVFNASDYLYAYASCSYLENGFIPEAYTNISGECTYKFQDVQLCTLNESAQ